MVDVPNDQENVYVGDPPLTFNVAAALHELAQVALCCRTDALSVEAVRVQVAGALGQLFPSVATTE